MSRDLADSLGAERPELDPSARGARPEPDALQRPELRRRAPPRLPGGIDPPAALPDPEFSSAALALLERRYLLRDGAGQSVESPRQALWRVAAHVASGELDQPGGDQATAEALAREFYLAMARRTFLPSSPILANAGTRTPMLAACFVLPLEDSIDSIYASLHKAACLHAHGGGTGFDFSPLSPRGRPLSRGGRAEGPLRFIEAYGAATLAPSPGAFRGGANMAVLRVDHPDILEFIHAKDTPGRLPNFNLSVALSERFLRQLAEAPDSAHSVRHPRDGAEQPLRRGDRPCSVAELWQELCQAAHRHGEPGLFFVDRANAADPVPSLGPIAATNPCGEQPLRPHESCLLASINLARLVRGSGPSADLDWAELARLTRLGVRFLDDALEVAWWPSPELAAAARASRRIGLGVMGWADALFELGLPYDSEEACALGGQVMRLIAAEARAASALLAEQRGSFPAYPGSRFDREGLPMRNSHRTSLAPTGALSILAGCSPGIEPAYALAFQRRIAAGPGAPTLLVSEVDPAFERAARAAGVWSEALLQSLLTRPGLSGLPGLPAALREVFVTAREIAPRWHLAMQAAFQEHTDAAISKTILLPAGAGPEQVRLVFDLAARSGVIGLTCYRDGSRSEQPLRAPAGEPVPVNLPGIMPSLRVREETAAGVLALEVAFDAVNGCEREISARLERGSESSNAELAALCALFSLWLRAGGRFDTALEHLSVNAAPRGSLAQGLEQALRRYQSVRSAREQPRGLAATAAAAPGSDRCFGPCPLCHAPLPAAASCPGCPECGWSPC